MRVIGLTGVARSGKDTVAGILAEELPGKVVRQGFADALKVSAAHLLGFEGETEECVEFCDFLKTIGEVTLVMEDQEVGMKATGVMSGREFLQRYGTEAHRDVFGEDFWLDAVLPEGRDDCDWLLIPDVRFPNEATRVKERGGEIWRVERPGSSGLEGRDLQAHSSEAGVPDEFVTRTILNDGSLEELRWGVREAQLLVGCP